MKLKKGFIILAIFLMFFSCMSIISAAENMTVDESVNVIGEVTSLENETEVVDVIGEVTSLENETEVVDVIGEVTSLENETEVVDVIGDFTSLQNETVNKTSVALDKDYAFDAESDEKNTGIVIDQDDFEIDGQGHTIDGKGQSRIFVVNAKNVVLKNINFLNGKATNGGALLVNENAENLKIFDCKFENNSADIGGAIDCNAKGCEVKNTLFNKNHAIGAGAACFKYSTTLIDDVYTNNDATYCGAIIYCGNIKLGEKISLGNSPDTSKGLIENCVFDNNTAEYYGVGSTNAIGQIRNTNFTNNHAQTCSALTIGTSYSDGTFQIFGCNFINNSADDYGAIFSKSNSKSITISKCNFNNNTAGRGAAICSMVRGVGQIFACNFNGNHAKEGGAIYATAFNLINRCNFDNNTAQIGGAISINQSYPLTFKIGYSSFTNNAGNDGEAIHSTSDVSAYGNSFDGKDLILTNNSKFHEFHDKMEWGKYVRESTI
ncbi:hypothetical protein [Methanobrevibacter sp.]|uniref:hypothetical protein n=1 Tax=Methanobrevibacter sp. TaxID=66852 RepID=UPI00388F146C